MEIEKEMGVEMEIELSRDEGSNREKFVEISTKINTL